MLEPLLCGDDMAIINFVYGIMGKAWDILFNDFVLFTDSFSGVDVTFGAVVICLLVLFYVIYKLVGA